jgi:flagellar hook-associated protein 3 FlgL
MRVASNTLSESIVRQIQQLNTQQVRLQAQVSSGQRITNPEDDPAAIASVLNLTSARRQVTQFTGNASRALAVSQASYSGLQSIKKVSDRAGELATLGTGTLGTDAMKSYATEANQLIEQAVQTANSTFNGDYLYAGTAVTTPPFTITRDVSGQITGVAYAGNAGQTAINLSETSSITPSTDGTTNAGLGNFINSLVALRDALNSGNTSSVTAAQAGLTTGENLLVSSIANVGGVQTRIEAAQAELTDRGTSLDSLISSSTDADLPSTVVKLNQAQTAYKAALSSAANIMSVSLLDYLK